MTSIRGDEPLQFEDFSGALIDSLKSLIGIKMDPAGLGAMQTSVDHAFSRAKSRGDFLVPFDGMVVVSARIWLHEERMKDGRVELEWVPQFYPGPRYRGQHGKVVPLGFYGTYDLYIGEQGPLPSTLIARYGDDPSEYLTHNPSFSKPTEEPFVEALERALFVNSCKKSVR
jgi:hypothetical protein